MQYIRKMSHYSTRDLARLTGLSRKTIWKLETGKPVNLSTLMILLEALKQEIEFLDAGERNDDF